MNKKIVLGAIAVVGGVGLLSGCGPSGGGSTSGELATDGTFTMAVLLDFGGMNPYIERQNFGFGISTYLYDSLVNISPEGDVTSGIAEEWDVSPTSITFSLRDDVTCSSGEELTAAHVAEVLEWNADPTNGSSQYGLRTSTVPGTVTADDEANTVTVDLESPDGLLLYRVGVLPIVCETGFADLESLASASDGTGPYVLDSVAAGESYTFTKREGYTWGPDGASTDEPGMPETVVFRVIPDESTQANLLLSGEINVGRVTGVDRDRLDARDIESFDQALPGSWLTLNHNEARVTAEPAVREALIQAVDMEEIIQTSTGGRGTEPTSLLSIAPATCAGTIPVSELLPDFDPEAAGTTLDAAGWEMGSSGVRERDGVPLALRVGYSAQEHALNRVTMELLASRWGAVGFDVTLFSSEGAALSDLLYKTVDFDVMVLGYSFGLPSQLMPYLSGTTPPNGTNTSSLANTEYETAAAEALTMTLPEACELWQEAERAIVSAIDMVPISNRSAGWYFTGAEAVVHAYNQLVPTSVRVFE